MENILEIAKGVGAGRKWVRPRNGNGRAPCGWKCSVSRLCQCQCPGDGNFCQMPTLWETKGTCGIALHYFLQLHGIYSSLRTKSLTKTTKQACHDIHSGIRQGTWRRKQPAGHLIWFPTCPSNLQKRAQDDPVLRAEH